MGGGVFGHWRGLNLWISHREDKIYSKKPHQKSGNKRGSDLNKYKTRKTQKLNPEPLNRSYDKINECLKVYGFYGLLNLDPTIKFKNSRVFIQAIN